MMKKRLIFTTIVIFLILAVDDSLRSINTENSKINPFLVTNSESTPLPSTLPVVTRVVDGDTIVVLIDGVSEKVRLIGVDTPETVDPRKTVQCFGEEASAFAKSTLLNKTIRLETDPSQGDRDHYGRLLRYVFIGDTLINEKIIADGYGHEYTYRVPYKYQGNFKRAETLARVTQKGLWAQGVCLPA